VNVVSVPNANDPISTEQHLLLCLVLMLNDPPIWRGGGRNFVPPFVGDWYFKSLLNNDPFPPKLGQICQEGSNLKPPPPRRVVRPPGGF